ncbi:hypothetical protein BGCPKDLD_2438 [Methylorubrum suomiense]|uniref:Uncharacterized protein n=1 Tax=Methylorubrum suomiense TaxID=144191 RepID=A0ABQ4UUA7_9HYPH|nr:hypothetical protein BGCPKDLD_2438 [Methylorubrum suomiense]
MGCLVALGAAQESCTAEDMHPPHEGQLFFP